jgi:pimeloyl-ACP methyl ester carboxylesterase
MTLWMSRRTWERPTVLLAGALCLAILPTRVATAADPRWTTIPQSPPLPVPLTSGYVPVNGIRMFYAEFGHGPPLLLLHGGLANSNYWGYVVPILVRHHYRVIVVDSRGHGRSTRTSQPYSYDLMADDVIKALDYMKVGRVDLVGWSDGGIIGLDIAMHYPERLRRLYAYGANADPSGVKDVSANATFRRYLEQTRSDYRALSQTPQDYEGFLAQIETMWARQPEFTAAELAHIRVRTAIVDGAHDEAIKPAHTEYLARVIPGAELIILPDVSHFGMLQNPREFCASVLKFLTAP